MLKLKCYGLIITTFQNLSFKLIILYSMFEQSNHRKYSVDQNYDAEQNHTFSLMFPMTDTFSLEETLNLLKLKYDSQAHQNSLTNACFRSHKSKIVEFYRKFKDLNQPQLQEPAISNFYPNECFVDLSQIGKYLNGKLQKYPCVFMGQPPKTLEKILDDIFTEEGYIPNFQRFLLFFPAYFEKYILLEKQLFEGNKIDNKIAYFIGLTACAQLGSIYGINRMVNKFTKVGGNIEWITKKKYPQKIKRILKLNRMLARSTWEINSDVIEEIQESKYWTKNQLGLLIQILCFSHSFATVTLAIGLNCQEINNSIIDFSSLINIKQEYNKLYYQSNEGQKLACVIENINRNSSNSEDENQKNQKKKHSLDKLKSELSTNLINRRQMKRSLRKSDNDEIIENYMKEIGNQLSKQELYFKIHQVLKPLLQDYHVIGKRTDKQYPHIDAADSNFKYTAFPLLYNLTNQAADGTLDLISFSEVMTNNNFGNKLIGDTKSFRKAIRYYCENLCGYHHFEYNYKNIGKYLTMPLKYYIRLLTLSPVHINNQVLREIKHEQGQMNLFDLGHIAIIVANSKMGIALTYAMHSFEC